MLSYKYNKLFKLINYRRVRNVFRKEAGFN